MSNQNTTPDKRVYRKRRRAELEEMTRQRITQAAIDLHGSVGPAKTTVSGVAERAGVQRATVYRHFPDERSLFAACSAHWIAANPLPDPGAWARIANPDERLRTALLELYAWFDETEYMLERVSRDAAVVPAMAEPVARTAAYFKQVVEVLMIDRRERGTVRSLNRAAISHALAFETWRSLVRRNGLSRDAAVELVVRLAD